MNRKKRKCERNEQYHNKKTVKGGHVMRREEKKQGKGRRKPLEIQNREKNKHINYSRYDYHDHLLHEICTYREPLPTIVSIRKRQ